MKSILTVLFCFVFGLSFSQNEYKLYRSASNPYYWKNKKPFSDYWQQDVHYSIKATVDDVNDIVSGSMELIYWNNSPDDLKEVYFHLYNNAQNKDSYLADLYRNNNYKLKFGKYRDSNLGTKVERILSQGKVLNVEEDNTLLKVLLSQPLKAGDSIRFQLEFKTYFDKEAIRNRMKMFNSYGNKHFDLVHWYPRLSVYDRKFGWDTDQHMDHEFYGDFGSFNVEITLPSQYILDGTGILLNEEEVLPEALRKKLDVSNFRDKPWNSPPSIIVAADGSSKTWKFSSVNVHDVAYTFDPTYRIGEARWNGIRCIALVQEPHAIGWQFAAMYVAKIIQANSETIGLYGYPKMIAADAQDGMEYPMLTLDGGYDPSFRSLFIHEISHNWFFGMLGTNETYRAFMDEGFTQFYTAQTWEKLEGVWDLNFPSKSKYLNKYSNPVRSRDAEAYMGYYNSVIRGEEATLNTHSDQFNGAIRHGGGYGQVYSKTATMLYNLKYVLGEELFTGAMQNYFKEWKMCHPYPEDFRQSFIRFTKVDLNWFFDQWIETTKTIDYEVVKAKKIRKSNEYEITFRRNGMQMPLDFSVVSRDSGIQSYHIPNNWFVKKTDAKVLPRWIGWDKVKKEYKAIVSVPGGLENVIIDTSRVLADVNGTNNALKYNSTLTFDSKVFNYPDRNHYQFFARPSLWYNGFDGVKFGAHLNGNYMNTKNIFDLTFWMNSGLGQTNLDSTVSFTNFDRLSVLFNFRTSTDKFSKKSSIYTSIRELDGLSSATFGFEKRSNNEKNKITLQVKGMLRDYSPDLQYLIYKNEWLPKKLNNSLSVSFERNYAYRSGTGILTMQVRTPFVYSDYDMSSLTMNLLNKTSIWKLNLNTRFFAQVATGDVMPFESMLFVAGANPEELMENKYTRSMGFFQPFEFGRNTTNFAAGGGLNLRGFMGYLLYEGQKDGISRYNYKGSSGAAFNAELEFDKLLLLSKPILNGTLKFTPYMFADAGVINTNFSYEPSTFSWPMVDAGAGISLSILKWWNFQTVKPLTIRADFPFFINRLPATQKDYLQFRWVIGVNRAF